MPASFAVSFKRNLLRKIVTVANPRKGFPSSSHTRIFSRIYPAAMRSTPRQMLITSQQELRKSRIKGKKHLITWCSADDKTR
jgi:hypothetical protein